MKKNVYVRPRPRPVSPVSPLLERLNAHSGPICHVLSARGAIGVLYCHSLWQQPTGQQAGRYRVA